MCLVSMNLRVWPLLNREALREGVLKCLKEKLIRIRSKNWSRLFSFAEYPVARYGDEGVENPPSLGEGG